MAVSNSSMLSPWAKDERGKKYGKLTVVELAEVRSEIIWLCQCECGNTAKVAGSDLRKGGTKSCGCGRKTQGGYYKTTEYCTWHEMKSRCYSKTYKEYYNYGGRGIRICGHWRRSFVNFLADMGTKPSPDRTIDRIDVNGNYSCGHCEECLANNWTANCRWATAMEQGNNTRKVRLLTHNGETMSIRAWSRKLGMQHCVISHRLRNGWTVADSLCPAVAKEYAFRGKSQGYYAWAREIGMNPETLGHRLRKGWPIERALTEPVHENVKPDTKSQIT